jgi:hypothetical protein
MPLINVSKNGTLEMFAQRLTSVSTGSEKSASMLAKRVFVNCDRCGNMVSYGDLSAQM